MTTVPALPVSGWELWPREATGHDELFLLEDSGPPVATVLGLARRLCPEPCGPGGWEALPAVELGALALLIRRAWFGDLIRSESVCAAAGCGERIDIAFGIADYLDHHRPRRHRGVTRINDETATEDGTATIAAGWMVLSGTGDEVRFRLPTVADLLAALDAANSEEALRSRCVRPVDVAPAVARRIDRALASLAPSLSDEVAGVCPACGATVTMLFDPALYALTELRDAAGRVYADVATLAGAFGWAERDVLGLPRPRRLRYVQLAGNEDPARSDEVAWREQVG